ncbi:hypothetical protein BDW59DRAFT_114832 [Aspergillus cavernicola]|uniref:C2H2-type domain-containing protein n=1 Tax=Aspergillus cavernicola TaxID=176166 RepID=A0ABR4IWB8_9EURO
MEWGLFVRESMAGSECSAVDSCDVEIEVPSPTSGLSSTSWSTTGRYCSVNTGLVEDKLAFHFDGEFGCCHRFHRKIYGQCHRFHRGPRLYTCQPCSLYIPPTKR